MKLYHLADVLTLIEGLLSILIMLLSLTHTTPPQTILFILVAAEICDALDGPCARRWHYPDDGQSRWWRTHCEWTDKGTDLLAGASLVLYITVCLCPAFGIAICLSCLAIGLPVQLFIYDCKGLGFNLRAKNPRLALRIVCIRRFAYALTIFIVISYLVLMTGWPTTVKATLFLLTMLVGIILIYAKGNRLREW